MILFFIYITDKNNFLNQAPATKMNPIKKIRHIRGNAATKIGEHSFLIWITYQTIKGLITTTFIWIPLIYVSFFS
jgi:hypothetical protein